MAKEGIIDYNYGYGSDDGLTIQERLNIIREKFSTPEEDLVDDAVFAKKTGIRYNVVNSWQNAKKNLAKKTRTKINNALGLKNEIWTDTFQSYEENVFYQKLDEYLKNAVTENNETFKEDIVDTSHIDELIYDSMLKLSAEEEDMLTFFAKDDTIVMPGNLEGYSPDFMFALAGHLKSKGQAKDALHVLDVLQASTHSFKYLHRKEILHLQAILLSEKTVQKWDEAIELLRYLYADSYHLEVPEVVTLSASNHKRKALYHPNGVLNHTDYVDLDALGASLSLYYEAYALKPVEQKYYDAINIAYIERILDVLESDESEEGTQKTIEKLFKDTYRKKLDNGEYEDIRTDMKNWWEVTTKVEFYILLGDDTSAIELYEAYEGTPTPFQLGTTIRQLELYTHFVDDDVAKGFLGLLQADLEKL